MKFKYDFYGLLDLNKIKKSLEDTLNISIYWWKNG